MWRSNLDEAVNALSDWSGLPVMNTQIAIPRRMQGPPTSGNGGYVAGLLGRHIDGAVEVTLRQPPPLETPLDVKQDQGGGCSLWHDDQLIAEAVSSALAVEIPHAPSLDESVESAKHYPGFQAHHFPGCFVCGPDRVEGDGLRIFSGEVPKHNVHAAPWTPPQDLADETGLVRPECVWAALDCPGYFAGFAGRATTIALLGRITARIDHVLPVDDTYISVGWQIEARKRKRTAGTAILSKSGLVHAVAQTIWIELKATVGT